MHTYSFNGITNKLKVFFNQKPNFLTNDFKIRVKKKKSGFYSNQVKRKEFKNGHN